MPADFSERNCIHSSAFFDELRKYMKDEQIPQYLGGTRAGCETVVQVIAFQCILPILSSLQSSEVPDALVKADEIDEYQDAQSIVVYARWRKIVPVEMENDDDSLSWYARNFIMCRPNLL